MKKKSTAGFALALLILSSTVSAGVGNFGVSRDFDTGTLGVTHYANNFSTVGDMLKHGYIFDLAAPSKVDAWLFNPLWETGNPVTQIPPVTKTYYDLSIFDSNNHELYKGATTSTYQYGSTWTSHVSGVLPAGDNYYVRVIGSEILATGLAYEFNMVAMPVPEPETYAMFLAGLGLLGWRMRNARS